MNNQPSLDVLDVHECTAPLICKYCSFTSHRPPPPSARTEVPWAANETGDPQSYEDTGMSCQLNLPVPSQPEGGQTHIPNPKKNLAMGPKVHGIMFRSKKVHGTLRIYHLNHLSCDMYILHTSNHENSFILNSPTWNFQKGEHSYSMTFLQSSVDS